MKNRISTLTFDPQTFPVSPHFDAFTAIETENHIIFDCVAYDAPPADTENFTIAFKNHEEGYIRSGQKSEVHLRAHVLDGDDRFKIAFSQPGAEDKAIALLDSFDYFRSFMHSFETAAKPDERGFSMAYLKKHLSPAIEGNDAFWERLYLELDMVTMPLNLNINRLLNGHTPKPVIVRNGEQTDISFFGGGPVIPH